MIERTQTGYEAFGASDKGRSRASNQDAYGIALDRRGNDGAEGGIFIVCDGIGGAAGGEVASRSAVESVLRQLQGEAPSAQGLRSAVRAANTIVYRRSETDPALAGMGTTLVALGAHGPLAWVVNIGDSRCYRMRGGSIECLTEDHSLVMEQMRLGQLTPAQAEVSSLRNIITRAVGTEPDVSPDLFEIEVHPGDVYLLASDGLTREVNEERIAGILAAGGPLDRLCIQLIDAANQAGGRDNITCLLARAHEREIQKET